MAAEARHRDAIVATAQRLFRKQGYAATGLNEIIAESGAPKGSLYHYFPNGKAAIGAAAVTRGGAMVGETLRRLATTHPEAADLFRTYCGLVAGWMADSAFRDGSGIATVLLELAPQDAAISAAGAAALADWTGILASRLVADGVDQPRALRLAGLAVAALDGALIQARIGSSTAPILDVGEEVAAAFCAAARTAP